MLSNYPEEEIWKPVEGYETYYVSNLGKVKTPRGKLLKEHLNYKGYPMMTLSKNNKRKMISLHRLVAKAFIPNPNQLPCINHIDENKTNNCVNNLEWCNYAYNKRYSSAIKVVQYDIYGGYIKTWDAVADIEQNLNIPTTNISKCCKGIIKTINGFIFLYKEDPIELRLQELYNRKHISKTEQKIEKLCKKVDGTQQVQNLT